MRLYLLIGLLSLFCVLAQEQQLVFGVTGAELKTEGSTESTTRDGIIPTQEISQTLTPTPQELHQLSLTLLHELTRKSPPAPASSYTTSSHPPSSTSSWPFSLLEDSISHHFSWVGKSLNYLYAGKTEGKPKTGRDYSISGVVRHLYSIFTSFLSPPIRHSRPSSSSTTSAPGASSATGIVNRWTTNLFTTLSGVGSVWSEKEIGEKLEHVMRLAREAGEGGVREAWVTLGDLYLTGHSTLLEADPREAFRAYTKASELGSAVGQYKLGFLYGSNYGDAIRDEGRGEGEGSQGSALLHYTFAALAGDVPASMTVGYRHWVGIGTKPSCAEALGWYKSAAIEAMRTFNAGPPGGRLLPPPKIRLSDLMGGPYGPGSSSSSRPHITGGSTSQTQQEWDDLLEFHLFHAERGDSSFMFRLGRLYYTGFGGGGIGGTRGGEGRLSAGGGLEDGLFEGGRDFHRASKWFMRVARSVWSRDPREATSDPSGKKGVGYYNAKMDEKAGMDDHYTMAAGLSAGFLGRMYLRGEGVKQDFGKAFLWFMRGSGQGDREANNGLGIMFRDGWGVEKDLKKANILFLAAAQQDLAEAQVNLGKYHIGIGDYAIAQSYFEHALRQDGQRQSDTFQSYYYLAELHSYAANSADTCPSAVSFYKTVAERGDWETEVWWEAERALERGEERLALLGYWIMAERGYEVAQNNVAWILDRNKQRYKLPILDRDATSNQTDRLALAYWTRSAAQDNVDALVKMGDYYYAGTGVEEAKPQLEKAAACYQSAANSRISALAMWNLGWMHENGQGVAQDYHLAKRFYDMALETSQDAYFPATLSLISLHARSVYNSLFGTNDHLKSLSIFGSTPVDGKHAPQVQGWSAGHAWRDIQRRWGYDPGPEVAPVVAAPVVAGGIVPGVAGQGVGVAAPAPAPAGNEGLTPAERNQELLEAQRALEGNDDPMYARRRVGEEEEEDDYFFMDGEGDLTGTLAIVALCMILAWLLYFRQGHLPDAAGPARAPVAGPAPPAPGAIPVPPPPAPIPTPPIVSEDEENEADEGDEGGEG